MNNRPSTVKLNPTDGYSKKPQSGNSLKNILLGTMLGGAVVMTGVGYATSGNSNNQKGCECIEEGTPEMTSSGSANKSKVNPLSQSFDTFNVYALGDSSPIASYKLPAVDYDMEGSLGSRLEKTLENDLEGQTGEIVVRGIDPVFEVTNGNIESPRNDFDSLINKHFRNTQDQTSRITFVPKSYETQEPQSNQSTPTAVVGQTSESSTQKPVATGTPKSPSEGVEDTYQVSEQNGYLIDYNGDGFVDRLNPQGENTIITDGKTGNSVQNSNLETRMFLIHTFDYDGKHQCEDDKCENFPSSYVLAKGEGGENIIEYFVNTNDTAGDTKFTKATTFGGFIDKVANAHVRGEYLENNFEQALESGEVQFSYGDEKVNNAVAYSGTFAQEVSGFDMAMRMGAGSAIYTTLKSDFLPTIEANSALVQNRGAGLNEIILSINEGGKDNLGYTAKQAFNNQIGMYEAQIKASEQNAEDLNNL